MHRKKEKTNQLTDEQEKRITALKAEYVDELNKWSLKPSDFTVTMGFMKNYVCIMKKLAAITDDFLEACQQQVMGSPFQYCALFGLRNKAKQLYKEAYDSFYSSEMIGLTNNALSKEPRITGFEYMPPTTTKAHDDCEIKFADGTVLTFNPVDDANMDVLEEKFNRLLNGYLRTDFDSFPR